MEIENTSRKMIYKFRSKHCQKSLVNSMHKMRYSCPVVKTQVEIIETSYRGEYKPQVNVKKNKSM